MSKRGEARKKAAKQKARAERYKRFLVNEEKRKSIRDNLMNSRLSMREASDSANEFTLPAGNIVKEVNDRVLERLDTESKGLMQQLRTTFDEYQQERYFIYDKFGPEPAVPLDPVIEPIARMK